MLRIALAAATLAFMASPALSAPCKDAKGKFVKCPTPAAHNIVKGKDGKCRYTAGPNRGKFAKCP
jgi:hypothetical protein